MANNPHPSALQQFGPPVVGSVGHPPNFAPSGSMQFQPGVPMQPGQQFVPTSSSQFHPVGQNISSNFGIPTGQNQTFQYRQQMQQLPPMHSFPGHMQSSQGMPMPYGGPPSRPLSSGGTPSQQTVSPYSNQMPSVASPGMPPPSTYMPWLSTTNQSSAMAPAQQAAEQSSVSAGAGTVPTASDMNQQSSSDWQDCKSTHLLMEEDIITTRKLGNLVGRSLWS